MASQGGGWRMCRKRQAAVLFVVPIYIYLCTNKRITTLLGVPNQRHTNKCQQLVLCFGRARLSDDPRFAFIRRGRSLHTILAYSLPGNSIFIL